MNASSSEVAESTDDAPGAIAVPLVAQKIGVLSSDELRQWRMPAPIPLIRDLALIWVQILGAIGLYLWFPHWATFLVAFALVAGGQHGLNLAAHEFIHYLVIPRHPRWNDWIGTYLYSAPVGLPFLLFRHRHFLHHRRYSTDEDTKTVYRHDYRGKRLWIEMLRSVSGFEFFYHVWEVRKQDEQAMDGGKQGAPPMSKTLPPILIAQAVIFGGFWAIGQPWLYLVLWLLPIVTLADWFAKIRATTEHRPLDSESGADPNSGYFRGTVGPFVRTANTNLFERLFICKINFNYHAEHHLWPQLSYQHLPKVRGRLLERGLLPDSGIGYENSYLQTIGKLWRGTGHPREGRDEE